MKQPIGWLMLILSLMGCSPSKEETAASEKQRKELTEAVRKPLDEAKGVEKQVFDSVEQQKKQADAL